MRNRHGFSLIEVVIATLVFSVGALALAAGAAAVAKQVSANTKRSDAAIIARTRAERAFSEGCGVGGGVETLDQNLQRHTAFGSHDDRFISAVPCE